MTEIDKTKFIEFATSRVGMIKSEVSAAQARVTNQTNRMKETSETMKINAEDIGNSKELLVSQRVRFQNHIGQLKILNQEIEKGIQKLTQ